MAIKKINVSLNALTKLFILGFSIFVISPILAESAPYEDYTPPTTNTPTVYYTTYDCISTATALGWIAKNSDGTYKLQGKTSPILFSGSMWIITTSSTYTGKISTSQIKFSGTSKPECSITVSSGTVLKYQVTSPIFSSCKVLTGYPYRGGCSP